MKFFILYILLFCFVFIEVISLGGAMKEKPDTAVDRRRKAFLASRKAGLMTKQAGLSTKASSAKASRDQKEGYQERKGGINSAVQRD